MDIVAINLRRLRRQRGMLQKELADRAEMNPSNLSKLERGEYTWTKENLNRLAAALRVGLDEFFVSEPSSSTGDSQTAEAGDHLPVLRAIDTKLDWLLATLGALDEGLLAASNAMRGVSAAGAPFRRR
jgi:transcriptional regulator with XRE-family HTH domain